MKLSCKQLSEFHNRVSADLTLTPTIKTHLYRDANGVRPALGC
jgi:hypothetical protein